MFREYGLGYLVGDILALMGLLVVAMAYISGWRELFQSFVPRMFKRSNRR